MINNDLLADRLNAHKNNEPIPDGDLKEFTYDPKEETPLAVTFLLQFFNLIVIFVKSLAYGFALKTVFATDWKFLAFLSVGFTVELILTSVLSIFSKT